MISPAAPGALAITGGKVFDPSTATFTRQDILVNGGKIQSTGIDLPVPAGAQRVDATGKLVTPGLIDAHVHAYPWGHLIGLEVDPVSSRSGVTTFVDGGSTGSITFLAFRKFVIEKTRSNLFAMLHVAALGQVADGVRGLEVNDCDDLRLLHLPSAIEVVEGNRDVIVAIKVRAYTGLTSLQPLAIARELADAVGLPMVVHLGPPPPSFLDILPYLRAGDYITHIYHPGPGALVDRKGRIRPEYLEAQARGVLIDTGTARFHTSFPIVKAAFDQGFFPDTITTDLTGNNVSNMTIDLPTTINKYLALGMRLEDALVAVTAAPARLFPPERGIGRLAKGLPADIAIFDLEDGEFPYTDYYGNSITGARRLAHQLTIKDGALLEPEPQPVAALAWGFVKK